MEGLHVQTGVPETFSKACLVLVHGAGEHSGRYEFVKDWFVQRGIAVVAGDLPGFGRSSGIRGHIDRFSDYVEVVKGWIEEARHLASDRPIFVLGHSMGGLVAVRLLQDREAQDLQIRGVILSSPLLRLKMQIPPWKEKLAAFAVKWLPALRQSNEIDPVSVSRSPAVVQQYATDPYVESKVSLRWYAELQSAIRQAASETARIRHPLLLLQAGADRLVDPEAVYPFMEQIASIDKKLTVYPELYHELLNEPEKEQVLQEIWQWIEARL